MQNEEVERRVSKNGAESEDLILKSMNKDSD